MDYDIRLLLHYDYAAPAAGGQHLARLLPVSLPGVQEVLSAELEFDPAPDGHGEFTDFFGNRVVRLAFTQAHEHLQARLHARVRVARTPPPLDLSPPPARLAGELARTWSLAPDSPHHFTAASPYVPLDAQVTAYAAESLRDAGNVLDTVRHLGRRLQRDFDYDTDATEVDTPVGEAFDMRAGVCQDFSHIMIAGLRGLGIPASYVSGFLRTIPPAGEARLEGADATHAWVRAWCGERMGWREFDPTNGIAAGDDHITIGYGRDYDDISPIAGVLKTRGAQQATQAVDVIPLE